MMSLVPMVSAERPLDFGMKNETKTMIEEKKATIDDLKAKIDECKGKQTEDCKQAKRDYVDKLHVRAQHVLEPTLKRAEQLEVKLNRIVTQLNATEINTTSLINKIDEARLDYDEYMSLFNQSKQANATQKDELMKQATRKLREAHQELKDAHVLLKEIVVQLRKH